MDRARDSAQQNLINSPMSGGGRLFSRISAALIIHRFNDHSFVADSAHLTEGDERHLFMPVFQKKIHRLGIEHRFRVHQKLVVVTTPT